MTSLKFESTFPFKPGTGGDLDTFWEALPVGCYINTSFSEDSGFWLSANDQGLKLLATLFAEISIRDLGEGWHNHVLKMTSHPNLDFTAEKLSSDEGGGA